MSANQIEKIIDTHKTTINGKPEDKNYSQYIQNLELSKSNHKLIKNKIHYKLSWRILTTERRLITETCRMCLKEVVLILQSNNNDINRCFELMDTCKHVPK